MSQHQVGPKEVSLNQNLTSQPVDATTRDAPWRLSKFPSAHEPLIDGVME